MENSFKLASNLRKKHHDICRKNVRDISLRNIPLALDDSIGYDPPPPGLGKSSSSTGDQRMLYGSIETPPQGNHYTS